jgi:hypothetical protein
MKQTERASASHAVAQMRAGCRVPVHDGPLAAVLRLQQTVGNQAVGRLLAPMVRPSAGTPAVDDAVRTGGEPLETGVRGEMERRFQHDFGAVRVHTDPAATASADAMRAHAYTVGEHVVFAPGQYEPRGDAGRRLLAHELAHVVQQRRPAGGRFDESAAERDARDAAHMVASDGTPTVREAVGVGTLQRDPATSSGNTSVSGQTATTTPAVRSSVVRDGETYAFSLSVEGSRVATGRVDSPGGFREDGGHWEPASRALSINFWYGPWSKDKLDTSGLQAAADLLKITIELAPHHRYPPTLGGESGGFEDQPQIVAFPHEDAPPKAAPQGAATPLVAPQANASATGTNDQDIAVARRRAAEVERLARDGTTADVLKQFEGLDPASFEQLQNALGVDGFDKLLQRLDDFDAVYLGSLGPVTLGREILTGKRVDYMLRIRNYGAQQSQVFYTWMFSRMTNEEIDALLKQLGHEKRLKDTVFTPDMAALRLRLVARGIDLRNYSDRSWIGTDIPRGLWEGVKGIFDSTTDVRLANTLGMYNEEKKLPPEFQKELDEGIAAQTKAYYEFPEKHPVETIGWAVDAALLRIPSGTVGAAAGVGSGIASLTEGDVDDAFKDFLPALIMLLTHAAGKFGAAGTAAAGSEEAALAAPRRPPSAGRGSSVAGTAGVKTFLQLDKNGALFRVVIDESTGSGSATHVTSGKTLYFENGKVVPAPASGLPLLPGDTPGIDPSAPATRLPFAPLASPRITGGNIPRTPFQLSPPHVEDFGELGRHLAQTPGSGFGTPLVWSVTPDGTVFATPPVRGIPLYAPDRVLPPSTYFAGPGQPRSWVLAGPLQQNFTPFDVLPGNAATTRTLNQVRGTSGPNLRGAAGEQHIAELGRGSREVTLQLPAGLTRRSDAISPTIAGGVNQEVKNYLRYIGSSGPREVPLNAFIQSEIDRDALIPYYHFQQPVWVFTDAPPSRALAEALNAARIPWIVSSDRLPTP